jgi:capsular polysaccharide biosynthesis protein
VGRRWPAALVVLLLTCLAGVALTMQTDKQYEATAQILLQPTDAVSMAVNPDSAPSPANAQRDVNTNTKLITSEPVARAVVRRLNLDESPKELANSIEVAGESDSNLVSITATDAGPVRAAKIATGFALAYRAFRRDAARQVIDEALAGVRRSLARLRLESGPPDVVEGVRRQIRTLLRRMEARDPAEALRRLEAADVSGFDPRRFRSELGLKADADQLEQLDDLTTQLASAKLYLRANLDSQGEGTVVNRLRELEVASATQTGGVQIVRRAKVPTEASWPKPLAIGAAAGFIGLLLALATALALDRFDRRLRDPEDIEAALGVPVLGLLPRATSHQADAGVGAYANLVARLELEGRTAPSSLLMVVACGEDGAPGELASGLAGQFAGLGRRALLIRADLRRNGSDEPDHTIGLSTLLAREGTLHGALGELHTLPQTAGGDRVRTEGVVSYSVLPSGPVVRNPGALLGRSELDALMLHARSRFDIVIVDSGALLPVSDTAPVARLCDSILLVAEERRTTRDEAEEARRVLGVLYEKVVGVAVQTRGGGAPGAGHRARAFGGGRGAKPAAGVRDNASARAGAK